MRISFDNLKKNRNIYCIVLYNCITSFSNCGSIFNISCTVLGKVSKSSLITSVTTVNVLGYQI